MKPILIALGALVVLAAAANAQLSNLTQAPVPLGGSDTRGLPNRAALPPMFGSNLFRTGPLTSFGTTPATAIVTPSSGGPNTAGILAPGISGAAAGMTANQTAGVMGGAGAASTLGSSGAAGAAGSAPQPVIPSTPVQPPSGIPPFDPNHVMVPGDVVQLHVYGATT